MCLRKVFYLSENTSLKETPIPWVFPDPHQPGTVRGHLCGVPILENAVIFHREAWFAFFVQENIQKKWFVLIILS